MTITVTQELRKVTPVFFNILKYFVQFSRNSTNFFIMYFCVSEDISYSVDKMLKGKHISSS